eukprot:8032845-Ditylum_brightwellii.AAC.1
MAEIKATKSQASAEVTKADKALAKKGYRGHNTYKHESGNRARVCESIIVVNPEWPEQDKGW